MFLRLTPTLSNTKDDKITVIVSNVSYIKGNNKGGATLTCIAGLVDVEETEEEIYALLEELKFK